MALTKHGHDGERACGRYDAPAMTGREGEVRGDVPASLPIVMRGRKTRASTARNRLWWQLEAVDGRDKARP